MFADLRQITSGFPSEQKPNDAYVETDFHVTTLENLFSALDILEDQLEIKHPQSRPAKVDAPVSARPLDGPLAGSTPLKYGCKVTILSEPKTNVVT